MSQKDKLLKRLQSKPKDFSFQETVTLLGLLGYFIRSEGKTSGSSVTFSNTDKNYIRMHKPHPRNTLLPYQVINLIDDLNKRGLL